MALQSTSGASSSSSSSSSSGGSSAAATPNYEKPTGSFQYKAGGSGTLYTVPANKYAKGMIMHTSTNYTFRINDVYMTRYQNVDDSSQSYRGDMKQEWVLNEGDVIKGVQSGDTIIHLVEYDK